MFKGSDLDCMYSSKSLRVFQNSHLVLTGDGIAVNNLETGFMKLSYSNNAVIKDTCAIRYPVLQ